MQDREPVAVITSFSRALRERGLPATPASSIDAVRALAAVDITDKGDVYFALRCVFATRRQDFALFDQVFEEWWGSHRRDDGRDRTAESKRPSGNPPIIAPRDPPKGTKERPNGYAVTGHPWAASAERQKNSPTTPRGGPRSGDWSSPAPTRKRPTHKIRWCRSSGRLRACGRTARTALHRSRPRRLRRAGG